MDRFAISMFAALALVLGWTQTAAAYPLQFVVVTVSDSDLDPGQPFSVTVTGCDVGEEVEFRLDSESISAICAVSGDGGSSVSTRTPQNVAHKELTAPIAPGQYNGVVAVETNDGAVTAEFTVNVSGRDIVPASITEPASEVEPAYVTIVTFAMFGLLFLAACAIAYWYLFQRERVLA